MKKYLTLSIIAFMLPLGAFALVDAPAMDTTTPDTSTTDTATEMPAGPTVSNARVTNITDTTAEVDIDTDEMVQGYVEYGKDTTYGMSTPLTAEFTASPMFYLSGLTPETLYHYRVIVMDTAGNAAITTDSTFTTLATPAPQEEPTTPPPTTSTTTSSTTTTPPPSTATTTQTSTPPSVTPPVVTVPTPAPISKVSTPLPPITSAGGLPVAPFRPLLLQVQALDGKVAFSWKKDAGVKNGTIHTLIVRKQGSDYVSSRVDGTVVYDGTDQSFTDTDVVNGTEYHYALYSYGIYGRFSPAARLKAIPTARKTEVSRATSPQPPVPILARDLYRGLSGDDVKHLQAYLAGHGFYPEAQITGYFGSLTRAAVMRFQKLNGIGPAAGYVGALTRDALGQ